MTHMLEKIGADMGENNSTHAGTHTHTHMDMQGCNFLCRILSLTLDFKCLKGNHYLVHLCTIQKKKFPGCHWALFNRNK